jgi:hypothetical protein
MMILSAAIMHSRYVIGRYSSMVVQTNHQKQTKLKHSSWLKSEYPGDRYNENKDGGWFQKKSCITANDDPLSWENAFS